MAFLSLLMWPISVPSGGLYVLLLFNVWISEVSKCDRSNKGYGFKQNLSTAALLSIILREGSFKNWSGNLL